MKISRFLILFFLVKSVQAAGTPMLIDIVMVGEKETPYFDRESLQLDLEKEYLFRIVNEKSFGVTLYHENFGKKIATYYLQGVTTASHESLDLPPNGTVLWHFMPLEQGEFYFLALTTQSNKEEGKKMYVQVGKQAEKQAQLAAAEKLTSDKRKQSFFQKHRSR